MNTEDRKADLHTHTNASDGLCTPPELVEEALWRGLSCIAITDHDTTRGVAEGMAAGTARGLDVLPGVELSCVHAELEVHMLGYLITDLPQVEEACAAVRNHRLIRMRDMVEKARALGLDITYEEVEALAQGDSVGRPHLARAFMNKGIVSSMGEAFERYIGDNGAAYVPKKRLSPAAAVRLIEDAGGIPVLAHPGVSRIDDYLDDFVHAGIRGLEVYYSAHTPEDERRYLDFTHRNHLVVTGGSDYHGDPTHGRKLGHPSVPGARVDALRSLHAQLQSSA